MVMTWTTPSPSAGCSPPVLLTTTPHQREDVSALDRFNVHRCPTRRVFSGTGFEPVTLNSSHGPRTYTTGYRGHFRATRNEGPVRRINTTNER
ncbi:hypothetical protein TNCV_3322981 [Trichonephila clavipes]|nr:hypothetical protein TNCV_3322981 [Trichonephila clavipes]